MVRPVDSTIDNTIRYVRANGGDWEYGTVTREHKEATRAKKGAAATYEEACLANGMAVVGKAKDSRVRA